MAFFEAFSAHNALSGHYILFSYKSSGYILWFPMLHCYGISVCVNMFLCVYMFLVLFLLVCFILFQFLSYFIIFFKVPVYIPMRERSTKYVD